MRVLPRNAPRVRAPVRRRFLVAVLHGGHDPVDILDDLLLGDELGTLAALHHVGEQVRSHQFVTTGGETEDAFAVGAAGQDLWHESVFA